MNKQATELQEVAKYLVDHGQSHYAIRVSEAAEIVADIAKVLGSGQEAPKLKWTMTGDAMPPAGVAVAGLISCEAWGDPVDIVRFVKRNGNGEWFSSWSGTEIKDPDSFPKAWILRDDFMSATQLCYERI